VPDAVCIEMAFDWSSAVGAVRAEGLSAFATYGRYEFDEAVCRIKFAISYYGRPPS
jgi:hypothetical protein